VSTGERLCGTRRPGPSGKKAKKQKSEEAEKMSELLRIPGFVSREDCRGLVACYEANKALALVTPNDFWNGRPLYFEKIPLSWRQAQSRIHDIAFEQVPLIAAHFKHDKPIFPETVNLVVWPPGYEMTPHIDNAHLDGSSNGMDWRTFSAVVYLNDDYEGGEIYFPNIDVSIKPTCGLLVAFSSGARHMHGVRNVTSGIRYTLAMWFTDRPDKTNRALANYAGHAAGGAGTLVARQARQ
jgi:predicted 2-oxoglutarate/Fe(II)-dependent dioxygenase YbiX